jgi:eukaryotic-like serine/threonine-protein kinase
MERREHGPPRVVGRYAMYDAIATGGMATVHFGRLIGPGGFSRTVVIKRLHAQFAADAEFAAMFLDEAKVAARIRHPNVVTVVDVIAEGGEIFLVMEYVHGESLAYLTRAEARHEEGPALHPARLRILGNVIAGVLQGLHAAHEATSESGRPLGVVHRDVSPQNILVGVDGVARVLDFGVAKAAGQVHSTGAGQVKGKARYLSPEQVTCGDVDRRTDIWAASVVLWESLTGKRLFSGDCDAGVMMQVLNKPVFSPRELAPDVPEALARVVMRGLERDRAARFATALEMAAALEEAVGLLAPREVGAWVERLSSAHLEARRRVLDDVEAETLEGLRALSLVPPVRRAAPESSATPTVRVSLPVAERPTVGFPRPKPHARLSTIAWASAAAVVLALTAGFSALALSPSHAPDGSPPAPPPPPAVIEAIVTEATVTEVTALDPALDPAPPAPAASTQPSRRPLPGPIRPRGAQGEAPRAGLRGLSSSRD